MHCKYPLSFVQSPLNASRYHGIATHYVHSSYLDNLSQRLSELEFQDFVTLKERNRIISETITEFDTGLPSPRPALSPLIRHHIDHCFCHNHPLEIIKALEDLHQNDSNQEVKDWAKRTVDTIRERSPIGVSVTLRALREGLEWTILQAFQNEHAIASVFMKHPDFVTGVTARLIKRIQGRPDWRPATLEDVTKADVDAFFANCVSKGNEVSEGALRLLRPEGKYLDYPHAFLGLPSEQKILQKLEAGKSPQQVVDDCLKEGNAKIGLKEKVQQTLELIEVVQKNPA